MSSLLCMLHVWGVHRCCGPHRYTPRARDHDTLPKRDPSNTPTPAHNQHSSRLGYTSCCRMARTGRELRFSELEQPQRPGWLAILADRGKLAAKTRAETVGTEGSAAAQCRGRRRAELSRKASTARPKSGALSSGLADYSRYPTPYTVRPDRWSLPFHGRFTCETRPPRRL